MMLIMYVFYLMSLFGFTTTTKGISVTDGGGRSAGSCITSRSGSVCGFVLTATGCSTAPANNNAPTKPLDEDTGKNVIVIGGAGSAGASSTFVEDPDGTFMTNTTPAEVIRRTLGMDEEFTRTSSTTPLPSPMSSVASTGEESSTMYDFLNSLRLMTPTFRNPLHPLKDDDGGHLKGNHADSTIKSMAGILGSQDNVDAKQLRVTEEE